MIDWLISGILGTIMYSIGLSLTTADFKRLYASPRPLALGLFLQLVALPSLVFLICALWGLPTDFAIGFMILAACPGGLTSNFISYLLHANTALSVSLTICNSTLTMLTVPLIVNLAIGYFGGEGRIYNLPFLPTAGRILAIVIVPVVIGLATRKLRPSLARWLQPRLRTLGIVLLGLVFFIKLFAPAAEGGSRLSVEEILVLLPVALTINLGALVMGRALALLFRFGHDNQLTLGVEVGIQNTSLAFLIAGVLLGVEPALKPALVYAMFSFFTALLYGLWVKPREWKRFSVRALRNR